MSGLWQLTDSQRNAVEHTDGPLLILAGPGSGKTRVVTHRIANLLERGVPACNILALTFTNKAANEMRGRVEELSPGESVWISTFHRFCSRLLREHAALVGLGENFTIYDMADSERALRHALEGLDDLNLSQTSPAKLLYAISKCKNDLISPEDYRPSSNSGAAGLLTEVYPAYQRQLMQANAVDFDDLLLHTVRLLRDNETLREELDERFRYIMVDEYQDTNLAQYAIVRSLSNKEPNLAVTGDPDQSIYGWRGANLKNILGFERDYPKVTVVRLEENFRSTPQILLVADRLITFNQHRKQKSLIPQRESGEAAKLLAFPSQQDESFYIADQIAALVEGGRRYKDFAILYRINALSRYLEHALHERHIPYQILNGVEFYQRKEVKDVIAYLQLINNPQDDVALLRVINTPARGLGKVTINKLADVARERRISLLEAARLEIPEIGPRPAASLRKFVGMIDDLSLLATAPVEEVLGHVLSRSGYEEFVRENDEKSDDDRLANIHELLSAARQFDMLHQGADYLEAFLEEASLVADTDAWEDGTDKVTLMTLHASKGLEFPLVFLVAIEQGKLPHERSLKDPYQLEEERRLMFVGLTRAQDMVTLSYAKYRDFRGQLSPTIPSPFLAELPLDEMTVVAPEPAENAYPDSWEEDDSIADDQDEDFGSIDFDPSMFEQDVVLENETPAAESSKKSPNVTLSSISTAAALESHNAQQSSEPESELEAAPRPDPNVFVLGMRVKHPEYGLGKVIALSGSGKKRTATVNFATAEQGKFVLAFSDLRPLK